MGTSLLNCGEHYNRLVGALSSSSTGFETLFPISYLYDGKPGRPARFAGNAAQEYARFDMARLDGAAGIMGWTDGDTGAGASTNGTGGGPPAEYNTATPGIKLTTGGTNSTDIASRYYDLTVRAGERWNIVAAFRGDGTRNARIRVRNLRTGKYLTTGMAWQTSATDCATRSAATWASTGVLTFTVEASSLVYGPTCVIRIELYATGSDGNGSAFFDDVFFWPSVNFVAVLGHTVSPLRTISWRKSSDNWVSSDVLVEALAFREDHLWGYASGAAYGSGAGAPSDMRYFGLDITGGAQESAIEIGELVVGQYFTPARTPEVGLDHEIERLQSRSGGQTFVLRERPRHRLRMPMKALYEGQWDEIQRELEARCQGGAHPAVMVYDADRTTGEGALVVHGRLASSLSMRRRGYAIREGEMVLEGDPYATAVA